MQPLQGIGLFDISAEDFCLAYPYHICFDKNLFIEHIGWWSLIFNIWFFGGRDRGEGEKHRWRRPANERTYFHQTRTAAIQRENIGRREFTIVSLSRAFISETNWATISKCHACSHNSHFWVEFVALIAARKYVSRGFENTKTRPECNGCRLSPEKNKKKSSLSIVRCVVR